MKFVGAPTFLVVLITILFFIPVNGFANVPGMPGYVPPKTDQDSIPAQLMACSEYHMQGLDHLLQGRNEENAKCANTSFNSYEISSSLDVPQTLAEVKTIVPKSVGERVISFFAGYKSGLEAAFNGKIYDPSSMNTEAMPQRIKSDLTDGYEAGYDTGSVFAK